MFSIVNMYHDSCDLQLGSQNEWGRRRDTNFRYLGFLYPSNPYSCTFAIYSLMTPTCFLRGVGSGFYTNKLLKSKNNWKNSGRPAVRIRRPDLISQLIFFKKEMFWFFILSPIFIQHCFVSRLSDSTVSEDAGIELRTVASWVLTVRCSNQSTRSHKQLLLSILRKVSSTLA